MLNTYSKLPRLLISDAGEVFSKSTSKRMKTSISRGYERMSPIVGSRTDKTRKTLNLKIHRMVAETFIPNPLNLPTVNHKDGNKLNNHVDNLEWVTNSENSKHAYLTGLIKPFKVSPEQRQKMKDGWWKWFNNGGKEIVINNLIGQKNYLSK